MNKIFLYILLLIMTILGSLGGYFFKRVSNKPESNKSILKSIDLYIGGSLYFISAVINIYLLKFLPYTIVLPLTSITYIWTLILSYKLLGEKIGNLKRIGVCLIIIGVFFIAK